MDPSSVRQTAAWLWTLQEKNVAVADDMMAFMLI